MGRPRKALETNRRHFTRAERDERQRSEAAHKVGREYLLDFDTLSLDDEALDEYKRIARSAHWLDDLDRNDLVQYCINWARARRIEQMPEATREILATTNTVGAKKIVQNPLWRVWRECCAEMRAISLKLGLSTIDRLKLMAPTKEDAPPNRFLQLMRR